MRSLTLFLAAALLITPNLVADGATPLQIAEARGPDELFPDSFALRLGQWTCTIKSNGRSDCRSARQRWRFRLPVDAGFIEGIYFAAEPTPVFVYQLSDGESGWAKAVGVPFGSRAPSWSHHVRGFNLAEPVLADGALLVAALAFVASYSVADGSRNWVHEFQYDGSGRTIPEMSVVGPILLVSTSDGDTSVLKTCYSIDTGGVVPCPAPPN